jgi:NAD(P)-dependent dehydrogenase (short-subunit alcohol dehydrogenase family)
MKVWVIGGTSGIGEAVANRCMYANDEVISTGAAEVDVREQDDIEGFWREVGGFEGIVYSAGINTLSWIRDLDPDEAMDIMNVNVMGFMRVLQVVTDIAVPMPLPRRSGYMSRLGPPMLRSVVAVSSDAATRPMRTSMAYCASKAALDMAVRCAARELAPFIRVNAVSPGMIDNTGMTEYIDRTVPKIRDWTPEHADKYERSQCPAGRRGMPAEVADLVFNTLRGPEYLTGSIITMNGGR